VSFSFALRLDLIGAIQVYKWSLEGTFKTNMQLAPRIWAMVALLCFDMIFVFATQFARGKAYNLFLCTHIVGFILVLPAVGGAALPSISLINLLTGILP